MLKKALYVMVLLLFAILAGGANCRCNGDVRRVTYYEIDVTRPEGPTLKEASAWAWLDVGEEGDPVSNVLTVDKGQGIAGLTISPDGETLYFTVAGLITDEQGRVRPGANIRFVSVEGGGVSHMTSGQWLDFDPDCDPEDNVLVFSSSRHGPRYSGLFGISTDTPAGTTVLRQTGDGSHHQPSLGSEGFMAFAFQPVRGKAQIWTMSGQNQYPTILREGSMPAISPDNQHIAYIGDNSQLWRMSVSGRSPTELTSEEVEIRGKKHPSWSPCGEYILFASDVGKDKRGRAKYDIWIIGSDGTGIRQITTNKSRDTHPVVSPDQQYVYFVSNRGAEKNGIWRIPFPGGLRQ